MRTMLISQLNEYYRACLLFPLRQKELLVACKISAAFFMAFLTGLMAYVKFPVFGSAVPVTGQT